VAPVGGCAVGRPAFACIVNVSEGRDDNVISSIAGAGGECVLDVHCDPDHHRTVVTMGGVGLEDAVQALARRAVELIDLRRHRGVHPRLGAVDVVPFSPLDAGGSPVIGAGDLTAAVGARDRFARWAGDCLDLPCFLYGPERTLPSVRKQAFVVLDPDTGPAVAHPTAGACAVGARFALVAYNVWLSTGDLDVATSIAAAVRGPAVRALGFRTAGATQVSCNLIDPLVVGPARIYDQVERLAQGAGTRVTGAELVGLAPAAVVDAVPKRRWRQIDLDPDKTFEARLSRSGAG
jgi:glutamate formiminotransferase